MLNIVIPMAGRGRRFEEAGYLDPKPFIMVDGVPMIDRVTENVADHYDRVIYIARSEHLEKYGKDLADVPTTSSPPVILTVDEVTEGAACTVLKATPYIDTNDELIIANSDQLVSDGAVAFAQTHFHRIGADVGILCFFNRAMKWSYAALDDDGWVKQVAEKRVISDFATCGIYWFRHGRTFVSCAEEMIAKNDRVNGEFYVAPAINYAILRGMKVAPYFVNEMHGLGTPEDLKKYEAAK
jgi:dTDP-glucose pyrophosphorylase